MAASDGKTTCRITLLGKRGSGKSATGNTILGRGVFSTGAKLGEQARFPIKAGDVKFHEETVSVEVMDTGELFYRGVLPERMDTDEQFDCGPSPEANDVIQIQKFKPDVFLYTVSCVDLDNVATHFGKFKEYLGNNFAKYVIVVFTYWDKMVYACREPAEFIRQCPDEIHDLLSECNQRYIAFNNFPPADPQQVTALLEKVEHLRDSNDRKAFSSTDEA